MFFIGVVFLRQTATKTAVKKDGGQVGVIAFSNLAVDFLPPIKIPKLTVQTSYPNVSPEEIENTVTQPIEGAPGPTIGAREDEG